MRILLAVVAAAVLAAQEAALQSTVRLVMAPLSVTDKNGNPVAGLSVEDMVVYDNNVPAQTHLDEAFQPLSLAIVVQATASAQPALDKLRKEASLLGPLLIGDRGESAVIAFANEVRVLQGFTADAGKIEHAVRNLDAFGQGGSLVDALGAALRLLGQRPQTRRKAILVISEKHDRGSREGVDAVVRLAERANATIYGINFSPTKVVFSNQAPKYCDRKCRKCMCGNCGNRCDREQPDKVPSTTSMNGTMNLLALFGELKRNSQPDVPHALARLTGGETWSFVRREGLSAAVLRIGEDLHHQYLVTFPMAKGHPGSYHGLRIEIRGRQDLITRTRSGYYEVPDE